MNIEKQKLLINYMVSSEELYIKISPIIKNVYFDSRLRNVVDFVQEYYTEYKAAPTVDQIKVETEFELQLLENLDKKQVKYAENELEKFCKERAMEEAIIQSPALIAKGEFGEVERLVKEALLVSISRDLGVSYFEDPEARLKLLAMSQNSVLTGWKWFDHWLNGINRKEMQLFLAPSGVGKSITMANLGKLLMAQGLNGIYFTLELAEAVTAKRFDSMFSGYKQSEILENITDVSVKIKAQHKDYGELLIKRYPESATTAADLRAYLKEYEIVTGKLPDFIIVDYLDLMAPTVKVSAENVFLRDKYIAEELRAIANDYNCFMITASQLGRSSHKLEKTEDVSQADIAGGISKINTADNTISITQSDAMKARGELQYKFLKTRSSNGVGNYYTMKFNPVTLLITDGEEVPSPESNRSSNLSKTLEKFTQNKKETREAKTNVREGGLNIDNLPFQI